jgi:hypothetical protein
MALAQQDFGFSNSSCGRKKGRYEDMVDHLPIFTYIFDGGLPGMFKCCLRPIYLMVVYQACSNAVYGEPHRRAQSDPGI